MYDVYYRKKGDKNAEVLIKYFCAENKESAKLIAQSAIPSDCVIIKIVKV